ncbi:glycosyltransferase family 4 protein [Flavobacterium sp.]|uniref:glycosyltransferase family 4 protein n=1 Tax=Flavobacterium sp. TaxID=239 RepID=UPI0039E44F5C
MKNPKGPTRIFVDCHVFDEGFQGTRTYIKGLYNELIADETRHFFFASVNTEILREEFGDRPNVTYLKFKSYSSIKRLLIEMPRMIRKHRIDFAHFQYRVPPLKLCKYIVTTHDVLFEDFPQTFPVGERYESSLTYWISAHMSEIVFTVSDYSRRQIQRHMRISNPVVMPNGVDSLFFEDYDKESVQAAVKKDYGLDNYLIYISRREPRKNQHLLLQYFIDLKLYENQQLVLVGHKTFEDEKFDAIYNPLDADIKKKILLISNVAFPEIVKLLRGAQAFIYPSIAEGFGIPPLEAAAVKIPVLCSNQTAMSDFQFFGDNLFNPFDPKEFSEKLLRIATSEPNQAELETIKNTVAEKYNWRIAADIFNRELKKFE